MNEENTKILWKYILKAGDSLEEKLPNHPNYLNGRNAYAHIAISIKKNLTTVIKI